MKRKKAEVWTVRWGGIYWQVTEGDGFVWEGDEHNRKVEVVRSAANNARYDATPDRPISLRIYRKDGAIQSERTYPRSADPRRSRG